MSEKLKEGWHLDKRVPITLIIAAFAQVVAFTWWASSLQNDIERNTSDIDRHSIELQLIRESNQEQFRALSRIEEQIVALRRDLQFTVDRLINEE